ncbi:MAG: hypothetical protein AB7U29_10615 [Desulfobulbus sp.]
MRTLQVLTYWFCGLFGVAWFFISLKDGVMYVPPNEVQAFLVALISGKWAQSYVERKGGVGSGAGQ